MDLNEEYESIIQDFEKAQTRPEAMAAHCRRVRFNKRHFGTVSAMRAAVECNELLRAQDRTYARVARTGRVGVGGLGPAAKTGNGVRGHIRGDRPEVLKLNNGQYFVPVEHDAKLHRAAFDKLIEAIDNHYPDSPEFATLYGEAKEMIGA